MGTVAITSAAIGVVLIVALVPLVRRSILPKWATVQVSEQSRKPSQFVRLVLLSLLWAVCLLSTLHFHFSLRQQVIVSHLFYVPIIIASLWWQRWGILLAVCSGAFLLLSHHFASLGSLTDDIVRSCLFVVVSATVAWLSERNVQAMTRIRESEERLRALATQLSSVEEQERRAIAAGLHDDISQTLALCKMRMADLDESSPASDVASISGEVRGLLDEAINRTRSLTFRLSPPILYELGFVAAVEWLAEQLEEEHGVVFSIEQNSQLPPIGDEVSVLLFRAVRELLINVIKHAQTNTARVSIDRNGDHVRVVVQDAGVGFDMAQPDSRGRPPGFGLFNVRERLNYVGGVLQIESQPGAGTRVAMIVPLKLQEQAATDKEQ